MELGNGVRLVSTDQPGRFAVIVTGPNVKRVTRVMGRRNAIRVGQHMAHR
jgi:hypothetical protein